MSNLRLSQHPDLSPTRCFMCGEFEGPFVDTRVDMLGYGHLWICTANDKHPGCARQIGRLDGLFDPEERANLVDEIMALEQTVETQRELLKKKTVQAGELLAAIKG